ncbi:MAG: thiamine phosphate synthase [Paludibacteraceae bacterium]|nr:thiamine phosphate synthase [Paludibacteraceae bacterium]
MKTSFHFTRLADRALQGRELSTLNLVTDGCHTTEQLLRIVKDAVRGGVTMVQLREKTADTRTFLERAWALKRLLQGTGVPLIINDRVDIALAVDADGVHLGQSDMPVDIARRLLGADKIIGLSVENIEQIDQANTLDIQYIGISPIFATPTKTDTKAPFGLEGARQAVKRSKHPTIGIGGINASNIAAVRATGLDGVAVVSAIMSAPNPQRAARDLVSG